MKIPISIQNSVTTMHCMIGEIRLSEIVSDHYIFFRLGHWHVSRNVVS